MTKKTFDSIKKALLTLLAVEGLLFFACGTSDRRTITVTKTPTPVDINIGIEIDDEEIPDDEVGGEDQSPTPTPTPPRCPHDNREHDKCKKESRHD